MKKLLNFLIICLISICLTNVNASSVENSNVYIIPDAEMYEITNDILSKVNNLSLDFSFIKTQCIEIFEQEFADEYEYFMCSIDKDDTYRNLVDLNFYFWNGPFLYKNIYAYRDSSKKMINIGLNADRDSNNNFVDVYKVVYRYNINSNSFTNINSPSRFGNGYEVHNYNYSNMYLSNKFNALFAYLSSMIYTNINYLDNNIIPFSKNNNYDNITFQLESSDNFYGFENSSNYDSIGLNIYDFCSYDFKIWRGEYKEPKYYVKILKEDSKIYLNLDFSYYDENSPYRFSIFDVKNNKYYGTANDISSIHNDIILPTSNYKIDITDINLDTYFYITLEKYNKSEESNMYYVEEVYTDVFDVQSKLDNFNYNTRPYFNIQYQSDNNLVGYFNNTISEHKCYYKFSNNSKVYEHNCTQKLDINFNFNGYIELFIKKNNDTIYNRKINVISNIDMPFIEYVINKKNNYSIVDFHVINQEKYSNIYYRYSIDNATSYSDVNLVSASNEIKIVKDKTKLLLEIGNEDFSVIYDKKNIDVYIDFSNLYDYLDSSNSSSKWDINVFNKISDLIPPGPVDSILKIPITMLETIKEYLGDTCKSAKVVLPFVNQEIELECVNSMYKKMGVSTFFESAGVIASVIILISYFTFMYNWIDSILRLENTKFKIWGGSV